MAETTDSLAEDTLIRFLLPDAQTRGAIIRAGHLRSEACRAHGLASAGNKSPVELFGQTLIASILLLSVSKGGVRQVLQLDGKQAPITRILTETRGNAVRGYLDWNEGISSQGSHPLLPAWLGSPVTLSTVRDLGFGQPYISNVRSEAQYLADVLVEYLSRSVQIRADIVLHHDIGLLLEAMPGCNDEHWFTAVEALAAIPNTGLDENPEKIIEAFAPLGLKVVGRDAYRWYCGCDSAQMARAIAGMDADTLDELKDDAGLITVSCRYCGKSHNVTPGAN